MRPADVASEQNGGGAIARASHGGAKNKKAGGQELRCYRIGKRE